MATRVEVRATVKPGRLNDAIADMEDVNRITERIAGHRGEMFLVSYGAAAYGGVVLTWDFPTEELVGRFGDEAAQDPEFAEVYARVTGPDSAWIVPVSREVYTKII